MVSSRKRVCTHALISTNNDNNASMYSPPSTPTDRAQFGPPGLGRGIRFRGEAGPVDKNKNTNIMMGTRTRTRTRKKAMPPTQQGGEKTSRETNQNKNKQKRTQKVTQKITPEHQNRKKKKKKKPTKKMTPPHSSHTVSPTA